MWQKLILSIHLVSAAVWLGAMCYSLFVFQPKARRFFASNQEFEDLVRAVAAGARWKVLSGFLLMGSSGLLLLVMEPETNLSHLVWTCIKIGLFLFAVGIFAYASWILWPARLLASKEEVVLYQHKFKWVGICLIGIAVLSFAISVWK